MRKRLPDIINLETGDFSKLKNFLFWLLEGKNINLYIVDDYEETPIQMIRLPSLRYTTKKKQNYMQIFLKQENIDFKSENNEIFLFNKNFEAYRQITAPLYATKDGKRCQLKTNKFTRSIPTSDFLEASYDMLERIYRKIKSEEIYYDMNMLSLDGGICAFMEDYDVPLSYLDKNIFYVYDLGTNPNEGDEPFHEYTYSYKSYKKGPLEPVQNAIVFDRLAIKRYMESAEYDPNIGLRCVLPKKVTGVAIGKGGCNIETIKFGIGIPKLTFVPYDCPPKREVI